MGINLNCMDIRNRTIELNHRNHEQTFFSSFAVEF